MSQELGKAALSLQEAGRVIDDLEEKCCRIAELEKNYNDCWRYIKHLLQEIDSLKSELAALKPPSAKPIQQITQFTDKEPKAVEEASAWLGTNNTDSDDLKAERHWQAPSQSNSFIKQEPSAAGSFVPFATNKQPTQPQNAGGSQPNTAVRSLQRRQNTDFCLDWQRKIIETYNSLDVTNYLELVEFSSQTYRAIGLKCANDDEISRNPEQEPQFTECQRSMQGNFWAIECPQIQGCYFVLPRKNITYDNHTRVAGGMGRVFRSNFVSGTYKSITVKEMALFVCLNGSWQCEKMGEISLGNL